MPSSVRAHRESQSSSPETPAVAGSVQGKRRWFGGLAGMFGSKPPQRAQADPDANALLAFPSETTPRTPALSPAAAAPSHSPAASAPSEVADIRPARRSSKSGIGLIIAGVAAALVLAALGILSVRSPQFRQLAGLEPRPGSLTIQTRPEAADVIVDGERRGVTPLTLSLAPGAHVMTVRTGADERVVPLTIAAGSEVTQNFEMRTPEPVALFGRVSVASDPPGARVAVDGRLRGISPVTVTDLTAEEHTVTVTNDAGSAERKVVVTAGGTASVMFSLAKASGPIGGWLSIAAPFEVEVAENGDVLGSSGTTKIMLAAGRHDVVVSNKTIGFQETKRIEVVAGKTTAVRLDPQRVAISVNARPWAEILLDGSNIGQTPIANVLVTVGSHELVFRHPQLAERKQTIVVTAKGPNRIAADLTK